eukprot:g5874.t1
MIVDDDISKSNDLSENNQETEVNTQNVETERLKQRNRRLKRRIATSERLFQYAKLKQKKMRKIAMEKQNNKPKDCTFTPRINHKKSSMKRDGTFGDRLYSDYKERSQRQKKRMQERDRKFIRRRKWHRTKNERKNAGGSDCSDSGNDDSDFEDGGDRKISSSKFSENYNIKMKKYLEAKEKRARRATATPSDCTFRPTINRHVKAKRIINNFSNKIKKKQKKYRNERQRRKSNVAVMKMYNEGLKEQLLCGAEIVKNNRSGDGSNTNAVNKWTDKEIDNELEMFDRYANNF